jgi:hypothetical protein
LGGHSKRKDIYQTKAQWDYSIKMDINKIGCGEMNWAALDRGEGGEICFEMELSGSE